MVRSARLFPSADGAITALTSSFCIDILGLQRNKNLTEAQQSKTRITVHLTFSFIFLLFVLYFKWLDNKSIIGILLDKIYLQVNKKKYHILS